MKKIYLFLAITFCLLHISQAQNRISFFLNTAYTFNNSVELLGEEVEKSTGYSLDLGMTYKFIRSKVVFTEIGLSGKTIFSSGRLHGRRFEATTYRMTIPLKVVFPLPNKKIQFSGGFVFQNNVDYTKLDFLLEDRYSWRVNFLLETRYLLQRQWYLTGGFSWNIRNIPDAYFINDPKVALVIGIIRNINFTKKKKETL
ncbi:MAG: hypothetical protein ACI85Q_002726 [Salibacteraceae bacterium]|jgi:hypothetical protein